MHISRNSLRAVILVALGVMVIAAARADDKAAQNLRESNVSDIGLRGPDLTRKESTVRLEQVADLPLKLFKNNADLEATSIMFDADFHFGVDQWFNHRVEAEIRNVDSACSGFNRTWEIYSFPPDASHWGIYLVDQGTVPPLMPGESFHIKRSLPSTVNFDATYVLLLSPGDVNPNNDMAIDQP